MVVWGREGAGEMRGGVAKEGKAPRILSQATLHQAWPSGAMEPGSIQAVGVQGGPAPGPVSRLKTPWLPNNTHGF